MTSLADQVIAALRSGHDDLSTYVAKLDESDLTGPSGAAEWDVAHVLSHLGSGAEISLAALERALAGGGAPPEGFNQGIWDRWNALGPVQHRDGFIEADQRLVERYEALDQATREELRIDLGFLPAPVDVAGAGSLRLLEFTLHTWDIKVPAEPTVALAPVAVPLLLDTAARLVGWIAKTDPLGGRTGQLTVEASEPARTFGLSLTDGVTIAAAPEQPDGTLRAPAEAWLRLITGRLGAAHTPAGVDVSGPFTLDDLRQVFPGY